MRKLTLLDWRFSSWCAYCEKNVPMNVYTLMGRTQTVVEYLKRRLQKHHQVLAHLRCMSQHKHCSIAWSENSACVSGNISESVLQGGGEKRGQFPQTTADRRGVETCSSSEGKSSSSLAGPGLFIYNRKSPFESTAVSLKKSAFLPTGELGEIRDLSILSI